MRQLREETSHDLQKAWRATLPPYRETFLHLGLGLRAPDPASGASSGTVRRQLGVAAMIDLIVNTKDKEYVYPDLLKDQDNASEAAEWAIDCARVLHPDWTSMVLTIGRKD